ncbi:MAG: hypothetical protein NTY19_03620 [Planctomycetota bacterium]|nr:hypothetical protein [Planctomycetota bacterium]
MKSISQEPEPLAGNYPWLKVAPATAAGEEADGPHVARPVLDPVPRVCLSRSEAAQALGIGLSTLKMMEREGSAPPALIVPGGTRLYPVSSLVEWAAARARVHPAVLSRPAGRRPPGRQRPGDGDGCLTPEDSGA